MSPGSAGAPLDVLVIGGDQAGLAMAYYLAQAGRPFQIVDTGAEIGERWRSRWDSLLLFTSGRYDNLPGLPFPAAPDTYPGKDDVDSYLRAYTAAFDLPVSLNARVTHLSQTQEGFEARHREPGLARPPGGGGDRAVPGALRATARPAAGCVDDPAAQRRLPPPAGPAGRAGAGRRRRQLRISDSRAT
jgi:hypothetical protein